MQSILVVEDDNLSRNLLVEGLEDYFLQGKAEVLGAASYETAVEVIESRPISVLITDMALDDDPEAGFKLIRFVKRRKPRTFIIVTTAYATLERIPSWIRAGAFEVVTKPFTFERVGILIQRALELTSTPIDRDMLIERLILEEWELTNRSSSAKDKGIALENLCSLLFGTIPGWTRIESRLTLPTEELDVVIVNESADEFWAKYGTILLVECKNWHRKRKPGRIDFDGFFMKLQRRFSTDCRLGFFVSTNGFASTFLAETRRILREPQIVVPLDASNLWDLIVAADRSAEMKCHVKDAFMGKAG